MTTLFEGSVNMYRNADDQVGRRLKPGQTMMVDTECGAAPVVLPHPFFCLAAVWVHADLIKYHFCMSIGTINFFFFPVYSWGKSFFD